MIRISPLTEPPFMGSNAENRKTSNDKSNTILQESDPKN
jgi:hypothetical protein